MFNFSNKDLIEYYFKKIEGDVYTCLCNMSRKCKKGTGFSNLLSHIHQAHPIYVNEFQSFRQNNTRSIFGMLDNKSLNTFGWIKIIVENNLPISFVEDEFVRKFMKLKPICRNTLKSHMKLLKDEIIQNNKANLITKFGIVFDAWSSNGIHFVCLFASSPVFSVLLKFFPFENEEDLSANSYKTFLVDTLEIYGKTFDDVLFLVSDNCSVNVCLASKVNLALIALAIGGGRCQGGIS